MTLKAQKVYSVSDLFFTSWQQLSAKVQTEVYSLLLRIKSIDNGQWTVDNGNAFLGIRILYLLRKNPRLVDKINEEQAVDVFNDLKFLNEPWFDFIEVGSRQLAIGKPDEKMARSTFDHFIYTDNEYSSFIATQDRKHLPRLVATLYQKYFDEEEVEPIANKLKLKDWQLMHTFFTYSHIREFVMKRCKTLMPSPPAPLPEGEGSAPDPIKATPTGAMWLKLKHRLSETPAFPGMEAAGKARMYKALDYLEDLAQISAKQKLNAKH